MAAKPTSMSIIKQIIRLKEQDEPILKIARSTGTSKNTVKKYLRFIRDNKLIPEDILQMPDYEAEKLFYQPKENDLPVMTI